MPTATITIEESGTSFKFDNIVREEYSAPVNVTTHKVESGKSFGNHAEPEPEEATIDYLIAQSEVKSGGPPAKQRALEARKFFTKAKGKFVILQTTRFGSLTKYVIENFPHEENTQKGIVFSVEAIEVRLAETEQVEFPPELTTPKHKGRVGSGVDRGKTATEAQTEPKLGYLSTRPNEQIETAFSQATEDVEGEVPTDNEIARSFTQTSIVAP